MPLKPKKEFKIGDLITCPKYSKSIYAKITGRLTYQQYSGYSSPNFEGWWLLKCEAFDIKNRKFHAFLNFWEHECESYTPASKGHGLTNIFKPVLVDKAK